jgi:hypothetical protein
MMPACVAVLSVATLQTTLPLPELQLPTFYSLASANASFNVSAPLVLTATGLENVQKADGGGTTPELHLELSLGCALVLFVLAAMLTLIAVSQAASTSANAMQREQPDTTQAAMAPSSSHVPVPRLDATPPRARKILPGLLARINARSWRQAFVLGAWRIASAGTLHVIAALLVLISLPQPALYVEQLVQTSDVPLTSTRRGLSLLDAARAATGTPIEAGVPVLLHGVWLNAGSLCGLIRPPPAQLVCWLVLALLVGPPTWRAVAATRDPERSSAVRDRIASAWRFADVVAGALLIELLLLPNVSEALAGSDVGNMLRRFASVQSLSWRVSWGAGAWLIFAAALCDVAGRMVHLLVRSRPTER